MEKLYAPYLSINNVDTVLVLCYFVCLLLAVHPSEASSVFGKSEERVVWEYLYRTKFLHSDLWLDSKLGGKTNLINLAMARFLVFLLHGVIPCHKYADDNNMIAIFGSEILEGHPKSRWFLTQVPHTGNTIM